METTYFYFGYFFPHENAIESTLEDGCDGENEDEEDK